MSERLEGAEQQHQDTADGLDNQVGPDGLEKTSPLSQAGPVGAGGLAGLGGAVSRELQGRAEHLGSQDGQGGAGGLDTQDGAVGPARRVRAGGRDGRAGQEPQAIPDSRG